MLNRVANAGAKLVLAVALLLLCVPAMRAQGTAEPNYKAKCAGCHGPDGSGNTAPGKALGVHDFQSPDVQKETDAQLVDIISNGKGKMPKYSDKLKDTEIKDLAAYVRTVGKK
jgi:mono/diheme cytochrome c family protein